MTAAGLAAGLQVALSFADVGSSPEEMHLNWQKGTLHLA